MKAKTFILKLLALGLLAGILINFACEFYVSVEQAELRQTNILAINISESITPSSSLFLFSQEPTEEENEMHRCSPQQSALHYLVMNPIMAKTLGKLGNHLSATGDSGSNASYDIIIFQHRFII